MNLLPPKINLASPGPIGATAPGTVAATSLTIGTLTLSGTTLTVPTNGGVTASGNVVLRSTTGGSILVRNAAGTGNLASVEGNGTLIMTGPATGAPVIRVDPLGMGLGQFGGGLTIGSAAHVAFWCRPTVTQIPAGLPLGWVGAGGWSGPVTAALACYSAAPDALEINNGTAGALRDLKARRICSSGGWIENSSCTVATVPVGAPIGAQVYVTNAAGGACLALRTPAGWVNTHTGAPLS